jgi:hypothetical protein
VETNFLRENWDQALWLRCNLTEVIGQAPVAYAYNPGYSGGRDQKDYSSKPAGK